MYPQPFTVQWLKDAFLFGINLTNDENRPFPDVIFTQGLAYGKQWLANAVDIVVDRAAEQVERHDLNRCAQGEWFMMRLGKRPIHRITGISLMIGATPVPVEMPTSWIQEYDADTGQFWIVPNSQEIQSLTAMQYSVMAARQWTQWGNLPGFIQVKYDAGFDLPFEVVADPDLKSWVPAATQVLNGRLNIRILAQTPVGSPLVAPARTFTITGVDNVTGVAATEIVEVQSASQAWSTRGWSGRPTVTWTACEGPILFSGNVADNTNQDNYKPLDADLLDLAGKMAAMYVLNPAGDLIVGAGIASKSQSVGGVSQSISTTSSPTNAGYGSRIIQYRKDITLELPIVRRRFHGMPLLVV